ncbi:MAG: hypothetical protein IRZ03_17140 [Acidobacterium ailaaui]|nr:hypothetical protein [Pseudacidobacterium ailaaui]
MFISKIEGINSNYYYNDNSKSLNEKYNIIDVFGSAPIYDDTHEYNLLESFENLIIINIPFIDFREKHVMVPMYNIMEVKQTVSYLYGIIFYFKENIKEIKIMNPHAMRKYFGMRINLPNKK